MLAMSLPLSISRAAPPALSAEPGDRAPQAGESRREPDAVLVDDRWVRAVGIPAFGIGIPRITGLLDATAATTPAYWLGTAAFVALAAAIWHGNRWLLFEQRRHWDWFDHPVRKLV